MSKHTPGPWEVGINAVITTSDGTKVASAVCAIAPPPEFAEVAANARLIAAAPEMLETLKDVYGMKQQNEFYANLLSPIIAKATGEDTE